MQNVSTVTIPKQEYEALKKDAVAWRRALSLNRNSGERTGKDGVSAARIKADLERLIHGKKGTKKLKKLPAGLRQALRDVEQGKLSGPFHTVDELMAHLRK
ncbi:hypothetical protein HY968_00420 [Candidatus Kaiserbacteria bacterium]|nr:hypothetical protein [Candidatus Kaiserbacteria bacterium]